MKKALTEIWWFLLTIIIGIPMIVVGYIGTFFMFGLVTGHMLYRKLHMPELGDKSK